MSNVLPPSVALPSSRAAASWRFALGLALLLLMPLSWLLARLVWLPMYFGLFFFLIAGLLVSSTVFRIARSARPLAAGRVLRGAGVVALLTLAVTLFWEYHHFSNTVGDLPHFADARNAAVTSGRSGKEINLRAAEEFKSVLRSQYRPGGPIGYALWTIRAGEMNLTVEGVTDAISSPHRGIVWPLRTLAALALLVAGLWLGFDSLRSPNPTTNVLAPGEEPAEEE